MRSGTQTLNSSGEGCTIAQPLHTRQYGIAYVWRLRGILTVSMVQRGGMEGSAKGQRRKACSQGGRLLQERGKRKAPLALSLRAKVSGLSGELALNGGRGLNARRERTSSGRKRRRRQGVSPGS